MKTETFAKANELRQRILFIDGTIKDLESGKSTCLGKPINVTLLEPDAKDLNQQVISFLKNRKKKLEKEFNDLK